jgi:hypothetical protein
LGCDDDRMSGLWNARADVTGSSTELWISSVEFPTQGKRSLEWPPISEWD